MNTSNNRSGRTAIILLALALAISLGFNIYFLAHQPTTEPHDLVQEVVSAKSVSVLDSHNFKDPVADNTAEQDMGFHRTGNDTRAVFYEKDAILKYFSCVWPTLTRLNPDPNTYHWAVGFYFVRKLDPLTKTRKLTFYVAPTLVKATIDDANNKPLDFMINHSNTAYYNQTPPLPLCTLDSLVAKKLTTTTTSNAYDAGQLWP